MFDEAEFCSIHFKSKSCILSFRDIEILPFEGQQAASAKSANANGNTVQSTKPGNVVTGVGARKNKVGGFQRKTIQQPSGKLSTNNLGIKETLNPTIRKSNKNVQQSVSSEEAETFTFEELQRVWKAYCLNAKRDRKENLYSALMYAGSTMKISAEYHISVSLKSNAQAAKMDQEKVELLGYLRSQLKNYSISLSYVVEEQKKTQILDSKGIFDQMAEENTSLNKFRKLFNLDIEF